ncbi:hypothetical protein AB4Z43_29095 [Mesorhizobium sp. 2RAF45]|uniref:hypothetical protein n=1 Tax=Mesorhizobium sp. 2RAF45 TaxID=3233001 RepID=UPI003F9C3A0E
MRRENQFFADWERSSASVEQIHHHWAFDIHDLEHRGRCQVGFIPRPLKMPGEKLLLEEGALVHRMMKRTEAINSEIAAGRMVLPDDAPGTGSIRTSAVRSLKAFAKDASVCAIETSLCCSLGPTGAICSKRRRIHICRRPLSTETCVCGSLLCCHSTGAIFGPRSLATTILQAEIHVM